MFPCKFFHKPWYGYHPMHDNQWHPGRPETPFRPGEPVPAPPSLPADWPTPETPSPDSAKA